MRKQTIQSLRRKPEHPNPNHQSLTLHPQFQQLHLKAHEIIKKYNLLKSCKNSQKNEKKLNKIYSKFMSIMYQLIGEAFQPEICRELIYILNRLVFVYEAEVQKEVQGQGQVEGFGKENLGQGEKGKKRNMSVIPDGLHSWQLNINPCVNSQTLVLPKTNLKLPQPLPTEPPKKSPQFRIFLYEKLKADHSNLHSLSLDLNTKISQINDRISAAHLQIEQKIRRVELDRIIQHNRRKNQGRSLRKEEREGKEGD